MQASTAPASPEKGNFRATAMAIPAPAGFVPQRLLAPHCPSLQQGCVQGTTTRRRPSSSSWSTCLGSRASATGRTSLTCRTARLARAFGRATHPLLQVAYFIAAVAVLFNYEANTQRFYAEHDAEIRSFVHARATSPTPHSIAVHHEEPIVATGQIASPTAQVPPPHRRAC